MKLLEKALKFAEATPERKTVDAGLVEECELALAYHEGRVYAPAVAAALGLDKSSLVSSWYASTLMKGIRSNIIAVQLVKGAPVLGSSGTPGSKNVE